VTACTVASLRALPSVRVLVKSFADHHPGATCHALLVDCDPDTLVELGELGRLAEGARFVLPGEIGVGDAELARLRTAFAPDELCAVLRPRLMRWLVMSERTSGPVLYLDPSVLVLAPIMAPVLAGLVDHSLVLVPRVLAPLQEDDLRPDAADLRSAGMFDTALVAVNRGAADFLAAWAEHAVREPADAFLDGAAVLLRHHVLRDPGIGLSVWNAAQRPMYGDDEGAVTVGGAPLRTVHFAGFDPERPWLLSGSITERPRVLLSQHKLLARLCSAYVAALAAATQPGDPSGAPHRIGSASVPASLRVRYRTAWLTAERDGTEIPPPLPTAPVEFLDWACAPAEQPGSTRWSAAVWADDAGLRRRFPEPFGADADGFREWCAAAGVSSGALPPEAVPRTPDTGTRLTDQLGVSVLGGGRLADLVRAAAAASGLPVSGEPDYPVVLCTGRVPSGLARRRHVVVLPDDDGDLTGVRGADEIWTLTETARSELDGTTTVPVHVIPVPVPDLPVTDHIARQAARDRLGWPEKPDAVVFAAVVDHAHERADNALGVITAFTDTFPGRTDVLLVLLVEGGARHEAAAERLRLAASDDDRIKLVERTDDRTSWLDTANCLLALHRAGTDRTSMIVADAAARGLPVLAVDGGPAAELLGGDSALLVPDGDPGPLGDALRDVADDPDAAARLGATGRATLLRAHALDVAGARLRDRVEHAYHAWRARNAAARVPQEHRDPLRPLRSARHVLLREPDVDAGYKIPMAPALRKAVLRVLNHYDTHLRSMLGTLVDGMERSVEELAARQDTATTTADLPELGLVSEQLDLLAERIAHVDDRLLGVDDGTLRVRADVTGHARRLDEVEDAVVGEAAKRGKQLAAVTDRLDRLTEAVDRTLDRMADLESRVSTVLREHDSRTQTGLRAAGQALSASDALRRVVLREHERRVQDHLDDLPHSSPVLSDAGLLRLPADDSVMLPLLSSNGVWEPELSRLIDSLVEPGGVFVDIGAYVGYHSLRVLSRLGTSGAVVAVEPHLPATDLLRHNVSVNVGDAVAERLTVVPAAAWDTAGTLAATPAMTGGVVVAPVPDDPEGTDRPTVPAVRLDREFETVDGLRGMPLTVVKVDIPGRGHRALGGLVRLLRRDRPHVFCAFSVTQTSEIGDDPITVLREFDTWGYDVTLLGDREPSTPQAIVQAVEGQHSATLWLRPRGKAA
jgi:FkbM family methyltransferase